MDRIRCTTHEKCADTVGIKYNIATCYSMPGFTIPLGREDMYRKGIGLLIAAHKRTVRYRGVGEREGYTRIPMDTNVNVNINKNINKIPKNIDKHRQKHKHSHNHKYPYTSQESCVV